jgi:hypothetical protein
MEFIIKFKWGLFMGKSAQDETDIRNGIKAYLELLGWGVKRVQQYSSRRYRADKGISDLLAMKNAKTIYVEVKTEKGEQSADQKEFEEMCIKHKNKYFLVQSIDDMKSQLSKEGLL